MYWWRLCLLMVSEIFTGILLMLNQIICIILYQGKL